MSLNVNQELTGEKGILMRARDLVYGALLTALSLVIPLAFGNYLRIYLPPFSATLASHVPAMLAMLISPAAAVLVGLGSALGFLVAMGPVIAARAAVHAFFGLAGALLIRRGLSFRGRSRPRPRSTPWVKLWWYFPSALPLTRRWLWSASARCCITRPMPSSPWRR